MVAQLEAPNRILPSRLPYAVEGLVQVFTSSHRTFFTGVMAQALQISGQGTSVLVVQFLKGGINQGYQNPVKLGSNLDWIRCDVPRHIDTPNLDLEDIEAVRELWQYTQRVINDGQYQLIVLDELSVAISLGFIPEDEVLQLLEKRPSYVDLILTGPEMPNSVLEFADQITEIRRSYRP